MSNALTTRPSPSPRIRVLVVDDSVVIRKILSDALRDDPAIEVVGTAANGNIALQRIGQLAPDLVTLDIEMPELDGISTLREIRRRYPRTRVIMCSTLTERGAGVTIDALALGADDYVTKTSHHGRAAAGESFQSQLLPKIKQFFAASAGTVPVGPPAPVRLTVVPSPRSGSLRMPGPGKGKRPGVVRPEAIAIGVSTGGPNALAEVIPMLPADLRVPVFIVQHMPPMFTRLLAERLQAHSKVKVVEGQEGMIAEPGCVYIAPGDYHMCVARKGNDVVLGLNQDQMENSCRPAVDVLFRSIGQVYGGATVSAILTGMGQDGLHGVEYLRSLGGYVIAQDEASSVVWGMPGFVVRAGLADSVCDLAAVTPEILRHL